MNAKLLKTGQNSCSRIGQFQRLYLPGRTILFENFGFSRSNWSYFWNLVCISNDPL